MKHDGRRQGLTHHDRLFVDDRRRGLFDDDGAHLRRRRIENGADSGTGYAAHDGTHRPTDDGAGGRATSCAGDGAFLGKGGRSKDKAADQKGS